MNKWLPKIMKRSQQDTVETVLAKSPAYKKDAKPEVTTLHSILEAGANAINIASKVVEFFSKPEIIDRLPAIASKLSKLAKFAGLLGPAGAALGVVVDILSVFGFLSFGEDPVMKKLNEISNQIEELRNEVKKGFKEVKTQLDINLALTQFLDLRNELQAMVDIFEQNVNAPDLRS